MKIQESDKVIGECAVMLRNQMTVKLFFFILIPLTLISCQEDDFDCLNDTLTDGVLTDLISSYEKNKLYCEDTLTLASLVSVYGTLDQIKQLPEYVSFSELNAYNNNALSEVSFLEDKDKFKYVLSRGADYRFLNPSTNKLSSIYKNMVQERVSLDFFKFALSLDSNFSFPDRDMLKGIFGTDAIEYFKYFNLSKRDIDKVRINGKTLVELAIENGSVKLFGYLVENGVELDVPAEEANLSLREYAIYMGLKI